MIQRLHEKEQKKIDYSEQEEPKQHRDQQNNNNKETKMGRKTTVWIFQAVNLRNLTRENLDMAKQRKP